MKRLTTIMLLLSLLGCEPYRIEYRTRPSYYQRLVDEPLPDREVLDDGTVIIYRTVALPGESDKKGPDAKNAKDGNDDGTKHFRMWEEQDDGTVILRALIPEHVLVNTLNCLRLDDYAPLWEQLVSERAKRTYAARGQGPEEFTTFFRKNRVELAKMLNRMRIGIATNETVIENVGGGVIECRFWPQVAKLFRFKKVRMVREDTGLKLHVIQ